MVSLDGIFQTLGLWIGVVVVMWCDFLMFNPTLMVHF